MKPQQFFYVVLGIIVVIAAAGGGGYYYAYKYMNNKSSELSMRLAEQKTADEQIDALDRLKAQYNRDVVPIIPYIDDTLPHFKRQSEILAQVQRLATSNGMEIHSVIMPGPSGLPSEVSQTTHAGNVLALPINFSVTGTTTQLQTFTSRLEQLNRFTNITVLGVTRKTAGTAEYAYQLNAYIKP
jgi:Tfp pilus assembly protein PilO